MRMRVAHQLPIHVEQGDAAESTMDYAKSVGHPELARDCSGKH
jgi:hypothetical protein